MWRDPSDNSTSVITMPAAAGREVLPQLLRVYNYAHCSSAENYILLKLVLHIVEKQNIDSSSVVQLLVKPDISSHPPQLPLRPNVQALRYLNFGQFRTPSNFGNCRPWDFCLLTRGHFVLSKQTCRVSLRPKSEKRMVLHLPQQRWWGAKGPKYFINVDFVNGDVKHHHHEVYWVSSINFNNPLSTRGRFITYIFSNFNAQYTQRKGHNDWMNCAAHQKRQICFGEKSRS